MPMNLDAVGAVSAPGRNSWTSKDALLYALGTGAGQVDPTGFELEFTTENSQNVEQRVLPTMPVVLGMGRGSDEDKERMSPRWIAPIVTWLASTQSAKITGRVFEASGQVLGIAEGWHRGPTAKPVSDPTQIGAVVEELVRTARKNAGMDGKDLD